MPTVRDILDDRGRRPVACIGGERSVLEAARRMNAMRIGSLVVTYSDLVIGILTERDVLVRVVAAKRDPGATTVAEVMTTPAVCCAPETNLDDCKKLVTRQRIRHIPVVSDGALVGIVTSGDIVAREAMEREVTLDSFCQYICGPGAHTTTLV